MSNKLIEWATEAVECYHHLTDSKKAENKASIDGGGKAVHKPAYFTEAKGKGKAIDLEVMKVDSAGRGLYFARLIDITDADLKEWKRFMGSHRVNALASGKGGRISAVMVAVDALNNMLTSQYYWDKAQGEKMLALIFGKTDELQANFEAQMNRQNNVKTSSGSTTKKGYDVSL